MKLDHKRGVTAGMALSVFLTIFLTGTSPAQDRLEVFLKTSVACAIAVTAVWGVLRLMSRGRSA